MGEKIQRCITCRRLYRSAVWTTDAESFAKNVQANVERKKAWHAEKGHTGPIIPKFGKTCVDSAGRRYSICPSWGHIEKDALSQIIEQFKAVRREILFRRFDIIGATPCDPRLSERQLALLEFVPNSPCWFEASDETTLSDAYVLANLGYFRVAKCVQEPVFLLQAKTDRAE